MAAKCRLCESCICQITLLISFTHGRNSASAIKFIKTIFYIFIQSSFSHDTDLFNNSIAALDAKYYQYVSPIGATFGIAWTTIYIWNLVGIGYIVYSLTLPDEQSPVKRVPTLVSKVMKYLAILSTILYTSTMTV